MRRSTLAIAMVLAVSGAWVHARAQISSLRVVDAHNHLMPGLTPDALIASMDAVGVDKIVVMPLRERNFADRQRRALDTHAKYPDRIIPFVGLNGISRFNAKLLKAIDRQLAGGKFRGMGEVLSRHYPFDKKTKSGASVSAGDFDLPADSEGVDALLKLAARHGVVVIIHMETTAETVPALSRALARNPRTRVIWAHQTPIKTLDGSTEAHARKADPGQIAAMLEKYPNLYADIATGYEGLFIKKGDGKLPQDWKRLYEKHGDRFVVGGDMPFLPLWKKGLHGRRLRIVRAWLRQLSPATRAKIASGNLERILAGR